MSTEVIEDIKIDEKIKKKSAEPKKYNVIMLNDDVTPMEWVVEVLKKIYKHSQDSAINLTMTIHTEGAAVAGSYYWEIAEQKAEETVNASRNRGFPLRVKIEQE